MTLQHGTHSNYSHGCRCEPCRLAHREYERNRKRLRARFAYGLEDIPLFVIDATEAREHLNFLRSRGIGLLSISRRTGIAESNLARISKGQQKMVAPKTAEKILSIPAIKFLPGQFVDAAKTKQLLDEIIEAGYTRTEIAHRLGIKSGRIVIKDYVRLGRAKQIADLHKTVIRPNR